MRLVRRVRSGKKCEPDQAPEVIKLFPCSTQLSTKFILLINVKTPTTVGILTFMSMINTISDRLKATNFFICQYFSFYEQLKFRAQLSMKKVQEQSDPGSHYLSRLISLTIKDKQGINYKQYHGGESRDFRV